MYFLLVLQCVILLIFIFVGCWRRKWKEVKCSKLYFSADIVQVLVH